MAHAELALELMADPDTIVVGERVQVTYRLRNLGKGAVVGDLCLDPTCGLLSVELTDSSGKATVYLSQSLLTAFTLGRIPVERTLEPGGALEDSLCLLYDARADRFAFERPGKYQLRAAFSAPMEDVISKPVTINVANPAGLAVQALEFIRKERLEPFLCNEAAHYDVSSKTRAALNALTKGYAKTPYAVGAEEGLRALGVRARLVVRPNTVFFGDSPIRGGTAGMVVELVNDGGEPLEIRTFVQPAPPFGLKEVPRLPKTLEPKGYLDVRAEFEPEEVGVFRGEFTVEWSGGSVAVPLEGQGSSAPALELSEAIVDFGRVTPGETLTKSITVTSIGLRDLVVESVSPLGRPFAYASTPSVPWTIPMGSTKTLDVVFTAERGAFDALIVVRSNDAWISDVRIVLRGEGAEAAGCGCVVGGVPMGQSAASVFIVLLLCGLKIRSRRSRPRESLFRVAR